jgi:hypothetical protein
MFSDNPNCIELSDGIYHYPGFLDKETVDRITKILESQEDKYANQYLEHEEFYYTKQISEMHEIWEKISEFLYPEYIIHPQLHVLRYEKGHEMTPHWDSPGEGKDHELTVPDEMGCCCVLKWGVITYFGEWEGGEVYYPKQGISIYPKPGDLIIHGALESHQHGVSKITSGTRYAFSNFSLPIEKNPGSFYTYKTQEYYEAIKDLSSWPKPLFKNPKLNINATESVPVQD